LLNAWTAGSRKNNDGIIYINSRFIKTTVIQVDNALTKDTDNGAKDDDQFQTIVDGVPRNDLLLVIGDWNAKVSEQQVCEGGKFGMTRERSDSEETPLSPAHLTISPLYRLCSHTRRYTDQVFFSKWHLSIITRSIMWLLVTANFERSGQEGRVEARIAQAIVTVNLW